MHQIGLQNFLQQFKEKQITVDDLKGLNSDDCGFKT